MKNFMLDLLFGLYIILATIGFFILGGAILYLLAVIVANHPSLIALFVGFFILMGAHELGKELRIK